MIPHFFTLQNFTASIISFSFISIEWRGRIPEVIPIMSIHPHPDVIDGESWKDLKPRNSVPYQVTIVTTKINAIHVKCNLPPPYATVYNIHVSDTCYYWSKDTSTLVSKKELTVFALLLSTGKEFKFRQALYTIKLVHLTFSIVGWAKRPIPYALMVY